LPPRARPGPPTLDDLRALGPGLRLPLYPPEQPPPRPLAPRGAPPPMSRVPALLALPERLNPPDEPARLPAPAARLLAPAPPRFPAPAPPDRSESPWRGLAIRFDDASEAPRGVPPHLLAVARSP